MVRRLIFLIVILLSLGVGLFFGWVVKPGIQVQNPLSSLREDFQHRLHPDGGRGLQQGRRPDGCGGPARRIEQQGSHRGCSAGVAYARKSGYSVNDIDLLMSLARDMQNLMPVSAELSK